MSFAADDSEKKSLCCTAIEEIRAQEKLQRLSGKLLYLEIPPLSAVYGYRQ